MNDALREAAWPTARRWLIQEMNPEPKPFPSVCEYLAAQTEGRLAQFESWIHQLHADLASQPNVQPWIHQMTVPARPPGGLSRHNLLVTQMSFAVDACPRGPPGTADVLEICDRNLLTENGNQTEKYPLEVLFRSTSQQPGDPVDSWSVSLSIGFGTTMACLIGLWAFFRCSDWTGDVPLGPGVQGPVTFDMLAQAFGPMLLKTIRLHAVYDPPVDTWNLIQKSLGGKIQASNRQRPNPCQMHSALSLVVAETCGVRRKAPTALWDAALMQYNKGERVKTCKLQPDEVQAIKLLAKSSEEFRILVRQIWGTDKIGCTSIPLSLIASKFLDSAAELPVDIKTNPRFYGIFQVTDEKKLLFIQRTNGRFVERVLSLVRCETILAT